MPTESHPPFNSDAVLHRTSPQGFDNILLIGMPASGKSVIGQALAKRFHWDWVDTDLLLERDQQRPLAQILKQGGEASMLIAENLTLLNLQPKHQVISTGGSAIYSQEGLNHLLSLSRCYYLHCRPEILERRVPCTHSRGVVLHGTNSLHELYQQRHPMYLERCHELVETDQLSIDEIVDEIHHRHHPSSAKIPNEP